MTREEEELNMRDWSYLKNSRKYTDPDKILAVQIDISTLTSSVKNLCMNTIVILLVCIKIKHKISVKKSFSTVFGEWSRLSYRH